MASRNADSGSSMNITYIREQIAVNMAAIYDVEPTNVLLLLTSLPESPRTPILTALIQVYNPFPEPDGTRIVRFRKVVGSVKAPEQPPLSRAQSAASWRRPENSPAGSQYGSGGLDKKKSWSSMASISEYTSSSTQLTGEPRESSWFAPDDLVTIHEMLLLETVKDVAAKIKTIEGGEADLLRQQQEMQRRQQQQQQQQQQAAYASSSSSSMPPSPAQSFDDDDDDDGFVVRRKNSQDPFYSPPVAPSPLKQRLSDKKLGHLRHQSSGSPLKFLTADSSARPARSGNEARNNHQQSPEPAAAAAATSASNNNNKATPSSVHTPSTPKKQTGQNIWETPSMFESPTVVRLRPASHKQSTPAVPPTPMRARRSAPQVKGAAPASPSTFSRTLGSPPKMQDLRKVASAQKQRVESAMSRSKRPLTPGSSVSSSATITGPDSSSGSGSFFRHRYMERMASAIAAAATATTTTTTTGNNPPSRKQEKQRTLVHRPSEEELELERKHYELHGLTGPPPSPGAVLSGNQSVSPSPQDSARSRDEHGLGSRTVEQGFFKVFQHPAEQAEYNESVAGSAGDVRSRGGRLRRSAATANAAASPAAKGRKN